MATIHSLHDYRRQLQAVSAVGLDSIPPPEITDGDIWGRDYGRPEHVLAGLFKVREILNYHLHLEEEWKHYLLCLLDAHYRRGHNAVEVVGAYLAKLKYYLTQVMTEENGMDLRRALVILDLMDKKKSVSMAV